MNTIAALNRRITVQRPASTQDSIGQPSQAWADVATLWANIRTQTGLSAIRASADVTSVQVSIRVRYRTDLNAAMRIVHGASVYTIKAVIPNVAKRDYTDIVCEAMQ